MNKRFLMLIFLATAIVLVGCAPWDTKIPNEFSGNPGPVVSIGPAIPLGLTDMRLLTEPQIDAQGLAHVFAMKSSFSYIKTLIAMRVGDHALPKDNVPIEITHLVIDRQDVISREIITRQVFGTVRGANSAFDNSGQLHMVVEYQQTSGVPAFLQLIQTANGWVDGSEMACSWLLSSPAGLVCALQYQGEELTTDNWITPQFNQTLTNRKADLVLALQTNRGFEPRLVVRDNDCPSFRVETLAIDPSEVAHVSYLCGETKNDKTSYRRRYASFPIAGSRASADRESQSPVTSKPPKITRVELDGLPLEVAPVQLAVTPGLGTSLLLGQCKSQEISAGKQMPAIRYCGLSETSPAVYELRDFGATLFSETPFSFGLLAFPQRPDGLDGEVHFLRYQKGMWSSPVRVARNTLLAVGGCRGCVAYKSGLLFLVTFEPEMVGRWIKLAD